jgi:hypothetical protein
VKKIQLKFTTDGSGNATVQGSESALGLLYAVQLIDGDLADGVDITLTCEQGDLSIPLLTMADFNTDRMVYPRVAEASNVDGSALTTTAMPVFNGYPKAVISQGGAAKSGGCILYVVDA